MTSPLNSRDERIFLLTLAGIQFSHILDFMIVMPLGPILMKEFSIGAHEFGLLVASYSFCAAFSGLLAATFVDRFERKRLLLTVFGLFLLATLMCGLASNYLVMMIARGLAGAFGGILGALVQTLIGDLIPFERRGRASGLVSTAFSMSTVAGVPISLWLANHLSWRASFLFIALLSLLFIALGLRCLPSFSAHLGREQRAHVFSDAFATLRDRNHLCALLFSAMIIFSGFTVIPYITLYAVGNVRIPQAQIPFVYLVGGAATLLSARFIGRWADHFGKVLTYRVVALLATFALLGVTHVGQVPLAVWLICSTSFFVLISGRMIPAMAIITSAAKPDLRGTFMSLHGTVQSLAMGLATTLSGFMIEVDAAGVVHGYQPVAYVAVAANLLAVWFVTKITLNGQLPRSTP